MENESGRMSGKLASKIISSLDGDDDDGDEGDAMRYDATNAPLPYRVKWFKVHYREEWFDWGIISRKIKFVFFAKRCWNMLIQLLSIQAIEISLDQIWEMFPLW